MPGGSRRRLKKIAEALGLTLPQLLVGRADQVIQ
jgi:hypothetical protein